MRLQCIILSFLCSCAQSSAQSTASSWISDADAKQLCESGEGSFIARRCECSVTQKGLCDGLGFTPEEKVCMCIKADDCDPSCMKEPCSDDSSKLNCASGKLSTRYYDEKDCSCNEISSSTQSTETQQATSTNQQQATSTNQYAPCNIIDQGLNLITVNACNQDSSVSVQGHLNVTGEYFQRPEMMAGESNRFFILYSGDRLSLKYLTLNGGSRGYKQSFSTCGGSDVVQNHENCYGGQILAMGSAIVDVYDVIFLNGEATVGGSIAMNMREGTGGYLKIVNSEFRNMRVSKQGAAIQLRGNNATTFLHYSISNTRFIDLDVDSFYAVRGGAIDISLTRGHIVNSKFERCSVEVTGTIRSIHGGAIRIYTSELHLQNTLFSSNQVKHKSVPVGEPLSTGGAISVDGFSLIHVLNSTFLGNTAVGKSGAYHGSGGAIAVLANSVARLENCNFEGNSAEIGGAIISAGKSVLRNVTLSLNQGVVGPALFNQGALKIFGAIITNNTIGRRPLPFEVINDNSLYSLNGCSDFFPCKSGEGYCASNTACLSYYSCEKIVKLGEMNYAAPSSTFGTVPWYNTHWLRSYSFCYTPNTGAIATGGREIAFLFNVVFSGNTPGDMTNLGGNPFSIRESETLDILEVNTNWQVQEKTYTASCDMVSTQELCNDLGFLGCDAKSSMFCRCPATTYHLSNFTGPKEQACVKCVPGRFGNLPGLVGSCMTCPRGYYSNVHGGVMCVQCPVGKFSSGKGLSNCTSCPNGWHSNAVGLSMCQRCLVGTTTEGKTDLSECSGCPVGKFGVDNIEDPGRCEECEEGQYQDTRAQKECKFCRNGEIPNDQKTSCTKPPWKVKEDCMIGFYLDDSSENRMNHSCRLCPKGASCEKPTSLSEMQPKDGYRRYPWAPMHDPFGECPFSHACKNGSENCSTKAYESDTTVVPFACSTCRAGFVKGRSNGERSCLACTTERFQSKITAFLIFLCVLSICIFAMRSRLRKLIKQFGSRWRDLLMLIKINITFVQIGGSLPSLFQIKWPTIYGDWLSNLGIMQFDILSMMGATCLPEMNYEIQFVAPVAFLLFFASVVFLIYTLHMQKRHSSHSNIVESNRDKYKMAEYLFALMDEDYSGALSTDELANVINYMYPEVSRESVNAISARLIEKRGFRIVGAKSTSLSRSSFLSSIINGDLEKEASTCEGSAKTSLWIERSQKDKLRSQFESFLMNTLLLFHAPISQRVFLYFHFHELNRRYFLREDYSMEVKGDEGRWLNFLPIVVIVMVILTLGLPLYFFWVLLRHRKELHTVKIKSIFGFMYARFNPGSEMWEIHEIFRKSLLCGALVYLPETTQAALTSIICLFAVASLNYFKPHRSRYVFFVCECAFVSTALKYLSLLILMVNKHDSSVLGTDEKILGIVLLALDVFVMAISAIASIAIMFNLWKHVRATATAKGALNEKHERRKKAATRIAPRPQEVMLEKREKSHVPAISSEAGNSKTEAGDYEVEVIVPPGAHGGSVFSLTLDSGQKIHVKVPAHKKPGDTIRVFPHDTLEL